MPASARSRVFFFRLVPGPGDSHSEQPIAINEFAPIDIGNDHFEGRIMLIHETGNEPELLDEEQLPASIEEAETEAADQPLRGVELQIQGRFKEPCTLDKNGMWVSAEIEAPLKLGFIMKNIAMLFVKFAQQKSGGRLNYSFGNASETPKIGFPASTVFKCNLTPPGKSAPRLGSQELSQALKYLASNESVQITPDSTVTFACATKFLDLCSWEVLNVPAASPLPLERLIGGVTVLHLSFYSLGSAGSHAAGRQNALLHFLFRRAEEDERTWEEQAMPGATTPLDDASDMSEASDVDGLQDNADEDQASDDSSSDEDTMDDSDEIRRQDTFVISALETWKPSPDVAAQIANGIAVHVPFYIEAIDRRLHRKLNVWYLLTVPMQSAQREWWHAMAVPHLASFCKRRPRVMRSFRRGAQAAAIKRYGAQSLEQFRLVICDQLKEDGSRLRDAVQAAATSGYAHPELSDADTTRPPLTDFCQEQKLSPPSQSPGSPARCRSDTGGNLSTNTSNSFGRSFNLSKSLTGALDLAQQMKAGFDLPRPMRRRKQSQTQGRIPPQFFANSGSQAVESAFSAAKEGRGNVTREGLVGAIHFEGRISEEWMRISLDGCVRLFTPFHCDKPRVRLSKHQLSHIKSMDGLFLGRFHVFELHTELRVFSFCCQAEADRDSWVEALELAKKAAFCAGNDAFDVMPEEVRDPKLQMLVDTTHVKRWGSKKRVVLNDRRIFAPYCVQPVGVSVGAALLQKAFSMPSQPTTEDLIQFMDATCILKAVQFIGWTHEEYLAFWLNVYHCLLLHGRLVFGTLKTRRQLSRFHSRVSYLVATVPVSLREIETYILRVPKFDVLAANAVYSRARAGQDRATRAISVLKTPPKSWFSFLPWPSWASSGQSREEDEGEDDYEQEGQVETMISKVFKMMPFVGKVPLPEAPWKRRLHPCLFMGYPVEIPAQERTRHKELRIALIINRGNHASMGTIPIFSAERLDDQLDDVSRAAVAEFVKVKLSVMGSKVLVLPRRLRGLWRELHRDSAQLIRFMWKFMPPGSGELPPKIQLTFRTFPATPRGQLNRYEYSDKALEVLPEALSQLDSQLDIASSGKSESWRPWIVML